MSIEIHVLFRGKLPTKPALAQAMKELGFPLTIPPPRDSLEKQKGFLPMKLRREEAGAEFDVFEGRANVTEVAGDDVDPAFERCASFRFAGDVNEMVSAMCAAAALAKLVGGVVLDAESGELMSVDEAIAWAKQHLGDLKPPDRRFGTRPSDVKRYLKPLLKLRNDLVLVDRLLLIRPVRHLIRGAYFERSGESDFRIWQELNPLYAPGRFGDYYKMPYCHVWQPHFEPLMIDSLAEDVFAELGRIVRLNDFGDFSGTTLDRTFFFGTNVISLVLAGERDRAAEFVAQYQNGDHTGAAKQVIREQWERVSGDIEKVCEEFHAREAATVKALKLEPFWEPSPFPAELPAAERARVNEPAFPKTPWINTPSWLYGEMPDEPGEVRFGKDVHRRNGREFFVVPLTREEAENQYEPCIRAERLLDGSLLRISTDLRVTWVKSPYVLEIRASLDFGDRSVIDWWMFIVREQATRRQIWMSYANGRENKRLVYDWRSGKQDYSKRPLTAAEQELVSCPVPNFDNYTELVARIQSLLESAGYGPWP
jgi:hypothetical protein